VAHPSHQGNTHLSNSEMYMPAISGWTRKKEKSDEGGTPGLDALAARACTGAMDGLLLASLAAAMKVCTSCSQGKGPSAFCVDSVLIH
jgi:hypothetical protein